MGPVTVGAFLVLFLALAAEIHAVRPTANNRYAVTNEDIRDAILQVVNVVRTTEDKLERHEYRERVLGEQLKKGLIAIDKRVKMLDPLKGSVGRLDERLAAVETILMRDERERLQLQLQMQKTSDTLGDIQRNLPAIVEKLQNDIIDKQKAFSPPAASDAIINDIQAKIGNMASSLGRIEQELKSIREDKRVANDMNNMSSENLKKTDKNLIESEKLLEKYENKLAEYNNRPEPPAQIKEEADWQVNFLQSLNAQKSHVEELLTEVKTVTELINTLPNKSDSELTHNQTMKALQEMKASTSNDVSSDKLRSKMDEISSNSFRKLDEVSNEIRKTTELTDSLGKKLDENYEHLKNEIQALAKVEQVMVQTADSVLDTKRRVEYGVHQILAEVAQQIKGAAKDIGTAIDDRFGIFELTVLDDETGALANFTKKIASDIDQVWRQIGIMHQQLTSNADTLNKLENQTEAYVNGTLNVMDNVKGKVGKITGKMSEVDDNLNYLMGRLSLVTQEFNNIKVGLGKALDEIRGTFHNVQDKIKDAGPGPHKISSNEITDEDNIAKKRSADRMKGN